MPPKSELEERDVKKIIEYLWHAHQKRPTYSASPHTSHAFVRTTVHARTVCDRRKARVLTHYQHTPARARSHDRVAHT